MAILYTGIEMNPVRTQFFFQISNQHISFFGSDMSGGVIFYVNMLAQNAATLGASMADTVANMPKEAARMAIVVVIVLPIACAYPFFQKYFISGLTVGAVKG